VLSSRVSRFLIPVVDLFPCRNFPLPLPPNFRLFPVQTARKRTGPPPSFCNSHLPNKFFYRRTSSRPPFQRHSFPVLSWVFSSPSPLSNCIYPRTLHFRPPPFLALSFERILKDSPFITPASEFSLFFFFLPRKTSGSQHFLLTNRVNRGRCSGGSFWFLFQTTFASGPVPLFKGSGKTYSPPFFCPPF